MPTPPQCTRCDFYCHCFSLPDTCRLLDMSTTLCSLNNYIMYDLVLKCLFITVPNFIMLHRVNAFDFCYAVPHNTCYTHILENTKPYFVLQQVFFRFIVLCNPAQRPLYTLTWKRQSLFSSEAGVLSSSVSPFLSLFFSFFLHPMPCSIQSFLNMAILHYNVFTKSVYNQTSNWL
jgi:hypothetical protein